MGGAPAFTALRFLTKDAMWQRPHASAAVAEKASTAPLSPPRQTVWTLRLWNKTDPGFLQLLH